MLRPFFARHMLFLATTYTNARITEMTAREQLPLRSPGDVA
jgi:hypothetical protein